MKPIGRIVATERKPNTAFSFHFWTPLEDAKVGIGTLVVAKGRRGDQEIRAYGVVVDGQSYSDIESPLVDFIGQEGNPEDWAPSRRPEIRIYTANVLRLVPEEPLQPVPSGQVYLARDEDVLIALGMESYAQTSGIPVGLYQNGEELSPIYLDWNFLLGPESAHLNVTGISGLATKTSAVVFLTQAIFQRAKQLKVQEPNRDYSVAALFFNVKGPDLLFLDKPTMPLEENPEVVHAYQSLHIPSLTEQELEMYRRLGLEPKPFEKVIYYAPERPGGRELNTLRRHPAVSGNVRPLKWGLKEVLEYTEVVLNRDDIDAKADALIEYIRGKVIDRESKIGHWRGIVRNFRDLKEWFEAVLDFTEEGGKGEFKSHHPHTLRKVYNRLTNLTTRYAGLLTEGDEVKDLFDETFEDQTVYVVDVSQLDSQAQDLVFTRVVSKAKELLEEQRLGVRYLIVFVDELNKYAPSEGRDTPIRQTLLDISERGRYIGLILFSAQQFRSQVHKRIVGNSATALYGRMDLEELSSPTYQSLTQAQKEKLANLGKGQLMLKHPHFSQPIFIRFPRPNVLRGPDGIALYNAAPWGNIEEAIFQAIQRHNPKVNRVHIREVIEGVEERELQEALGLYRLEKSIPPKEAVSRFAQLIRKKARLDDLGGNGSDRPTPQFPEEADQWDPFAGEEEFG